MAGLHHHDPLAPADETPQLLLKHGRLASLALHLEIQVSVSHADYRNVFPVGVGSRKQLQQMLNIYCHNLSLLVHICLVPAARGNHRVGGRVVRE